MFDKGNFWFLACFVLVFLMISCTNKAIENTEKVDFIVIKDDLAREVQVRKNANRFLSLAPSVTEMLYFICDSSKIVGRTPTCNFPKEALLKPIVNNYPPDLERILFLRPDLVITKDGMLSLAQAEAIEKMGIPVYFQNYDTVEDIFLGIKKLGILTGNENSAKIKSDSLRKTLSNEFRNEKVKETVLILISKERYFVFGKNTYASDILLASGAINAVDSLFDNPYPVVTAEYILSVNPDVIIGGKDVGLQNDFFELHKELKRTNAFKNKRVYTINDDYISRPGPRVVEAILTIRSMIKGTYSNTSLK